MSHNLINLAGQFEYLNYLNNTNVFANNNWLSFGKNMLDFIKKISQRPTGFLLWAKYTSTQSSR